MNGVLVDVLTRLQQATRAYRESSTVDALDASYAVDEINNELGELLCPLDDRPDFDLSALALPAQAAADAAGVDYEASHLALRELLSVADLRQNPDWTPYFAVASADLARARAAYDQVEAARLRALVDALEVQG